MYCTCTVHVLNHGNFKNNIFQLNKHKDRLNIFIYYISVPKKSIEDLILMLLITKRRTWKYVRLMEQKCTITVLISINIFLTVEIFST